MSKIKPIVIVVDKDGRVSMTVDEMKKLLDDAFEQGKESGTTTINNYPYHQYRAWWNDPYYATISTTTCGNATTIFGTTTSTNTNFTVEGKAE